MKIRCPICIKPGISPIRGLFNRGAATCVYCRGESRSAPTLPRVSVEFALFLILLILGYWIGRRSTAPRYWIVPILVSLLIPVWSVFTSPREVVGETRPLHKTLWLFIIVAVELLAARALIGLLFAPT